MAQYRFHARLLVLFCIVVVALGSVETARAARFHVAVGGLRSVGESVPEDWTLDNCYPSLTTACLATSANDSVLLAPETHSVVGYVYLPCFLGNADLSDDETGTTILCSPYAQMQVPSTLPGFEARGLTVAGDQADSHRAAILLTNGLLGQGTIRFAHCTFRDLTGSDAYHHGGSCIDGNGNGLGTAVEIDACLFTGNTTRGRGGAVFFANGYEVTITASQFTENTSRPGVDGDDARGGALAVVSSASPTTVSCIDVVFADNTSWGPGGAIYIDDGSLSLVDCEVRGSSSAVGQVTHWSAGAGVFMYRTDAVHTAPTTLHVDNCLFTRNIGTIVDNSYAGDGGGILVKGNTGLMVEATVANTTFSENFNSQGAGLYVGRYANADVSHCRFLNNSAFMQGGATYKGGVFADNLGETVVYTYCEFTGNRAGVREDGSDSTDYGRGGAFSTRFYTRAEFHNCTFYDNTVHGPIQEGDAVMLPSEGYTFDSDLQRCDFVNTVFYGTSGNSIQLIARNGAIGRLENCAFEHGQVQFAGAVPVDPVYIINYPFSSPTELWPADGSALINAAQDEGQTVDLAGISVPNGQAPDIGAYEAPYGYSPVGENDAAARLVQVRPNPFTSTTEFRFSLPQGSGRLEVFDVAGRKVRTLSATSESVEMFSATWNGRDDRGRRLPAGTYFCKVHSGRSVLTERVVLLR